MASRRIEDLHPDLQPLYLEFTKQCTAVGIEVLTTCTYRSNAEQDELYSHGRTKPGPRVTNARAGQSEHNFTLNGRPAARAFDVVPLIGGKPMWDDCHPHWQTMGKIGISLGLNWYGKSGARFREFPHFALPKEIQ